MDASDLQREIDGWLPDILYATHPKAPELTRSFFSKQRNKLTAEAYFRILRAFLEWAEHGEFASLADLTPTHLSNYVKGLQRVRQAPQKGDLSPRTRAQTLACLRGYFKALVCGGAIPANPTLDLKVSDDSENTGRALQLKFADMSRLLASFDTDNLRDLRDRAIIAVMAYSCARVGAVCKLRHRSLYRTGGRLHLRLQEKRGKIHKVPCHPMLEQYLCEYLGRSTHPAKDCEPNPEGWLFRKWDKGRKLLTAKPVTNMVCYQMVKHRTGKLGIEGITNHSFRATGITEFLNAGGMMEEARRLANHSSVVTTKLYDGRREDVQTEDVDRLPVWDGTGRR
ncbi:MAG: tyrosine-type recombinase/integrase [Hyphomicrobiaceae bacterium]